MMWRAKRTAIGQGTAFDLTGHRGNHRYLEQFRGGQRRKNGGKPGRQHRLAGAGRTDEQKVVAAGGGDFQGTLGALLPLDVFEIYERLGELADLRLRPGKHLGPAKVVGELYQGSGRNDLHLRACPRRFRAARRGTDETFATGIRANGSRQHPCNWRNGAVEPKLPENRESR
jgi:hypothetical protein